MNGSREPLQIVGAGLAGSCLAWRMWRRGVPFRLIDRGHGGSTRVAAGLVNPVTGKNFTPSWRLAEFLPEAVRFYHEIEETVGRKIWHPLPVLRLARTEEEWRKIQGKLDEPDVRPWVGPVEEDVPEGFVRGVEVTGGGRLDTMAFLDATREFFETAGAYEEREETGDPPGAVHCEGAAALLAGKLGPHRCAKGEILTLRATGWDESRIRVGGGGWLVPVGDRLFRCGATYEWDRLDETPTAEGRRRIEEIARVLGGGDFEVIDQLAGIRPILRRSQPLVGPLGNGWVFNGLGSKGSLYAPGVAGRLARWIVEGVEVDEDLDIRNWR